MPAFISTIKAKSAPLQEPFEFNKSIDYKGEKLSQLKTFKQRKGVYKVKLFQDSNADQDFTKNEIIFKGKIYDNCFAGCGEHLTNFVGTVKFTKKMHQCEWDTQKQLKKHGNNEVLCTRDYVPIIYELKLRSDWTGVGN